MGKSIEVDGNTHTLIDANCHVSKIKSIEQKPVTMAVFLRIHWLPHGFKEKVVNYIYSEAPFLTVIDASVEKWEKGKSQIENGIISVKVNYQVEYNEKFLACSQYDCLD